MKVAVTGAAGHIGNVICRRLLERGHEVRALVYRESQSLDGLGLEKIQGDILDEQILDALLKNVDAVCHSAAMISIGDVAPNLVHTTNVIGTQKVLDAAIRNGVGQFSYLSSVHAHHSPGLNGTMNENTPYVGADNRSAYDRSKAAAEKAVLAARDRGLNTLIFNPTAVIGPYDFKPGLSGQMVLRLARKKIPMLTPLGFDWVDARDVANAVVHAMEQEISNEKFMLPGSWCSVQELAEIICRYAKVPAPRFTAPFWLARTGVPFIGLYSRMTGQAPLYTYESLRTLEETCQNVEGNHAARMLQYRPRLLEETIADTVNWFTKNGYLQPKST